MTCLILHEDLGRKGMCKKSIPVSITDYLPAMLVRCLLVKRGMQISHLPYSSGSAQANVIFISCSEKYSQRKKFWDNEDITNYVTARLNTVSLDASKTVLCNI
jgi:hypothetical protein